MNAPSPQLPRDPTMVARVTRVLHFDEIANQLEQAAIQINIALMFAETGDAFGLGYALKGGVGHFKAAVRFANDLTELERAACAAEHEQSDVTEAAE
ncbi:hypothetical protein Msil_3096 [Methylocella silvestris BL2]|uniref:Uncharacterized protein n=1 Tax=Methylocella silvestris (strain DSM 15510 / CIP 108128 / LMG 27833 / NCIMB 13906 / BL2) TaxID=395965 RepID=B8EKX7_METSB|nr:hypothetical protein [Methylocella silvestris]ACK52005.1 hypothetical protein Msil_3096 [Methylocella silvestris BL2]